MYDLNNAIRLPHYPKIIDLNVKTKHFLKCSYVLNKQTDPLNLGIYGIMQFIMGFPQETAERCIHNENQ